MPTVTTVIPTYNRAAMLVEALESALGQTRPPDEIIVVDDGSTDNTAEVADRYGSKIRYIRQKNAGPSAARNHGIREATGDFVAFLDSDDLWAKDRLEKQFAALSTHPDLDFIFGLESKFDKKGDFQKCEIKSPEVLLQLNEINCVIPSAFELLLRENVVPTSTVLFRRSRTREIGYIDESISQAEDYDFWLRFALAGCRFGFINAVLCHRRIHEGNLVNQWANSTTSIVAVLRRYLERSPAMRYQVSQRINGMEYDLGSYYLYKRKFTLAHIHLSMSNPPGIKRYVCAAKRIVARLLSA